MASVLQEKLHVQRRALVVDDSNIARHVLAGLLGRLGFDVDVADSAEAALEQLAGPLPDVVFMDHLMPGMDGLEAVRRLRAHSRTARLPIVMYTSQDTVEFHDRARLAGADGIYCKASDRGRLAEILARLDLVSVDAKTDASTPKVLPFRSEPRNIDSAQAAARANGAGQASSLEPLLHTYHEKLHQDLLAEFAILERYEERMRRDMFARVDKLTHRTLQRVDRYFDEQRLEREQERRASRWRGRAMAAAILLALGVTLGMGWFVSQRTQALEFQGASLQASVEAQSETLRDLQASLRQLDSAAAAGAPYLDRGPAAVPSPGGERGSWTAGPSQLGRPAAAALVAELQSMGILGPVQIETSAGSFCVVATDGGFELGTSNGALRNCDVLPVGGPASGW